MWEEEVTELTKELKNRELDRLRDAAKEERERSGKQLDEQEREIMRLKTLLQGEKSEWYRLIDQEKAKYVIQQIHCMVSCLRLILGGEQIDQWNWRLYIRSWILNELKSKHWREQLQ